MMYNLLRIFKILNITMLILFSLLSILTVDAVLENLSVDKQINEFMSKGIYSHNYRSFYFYEVLIEEELTTPSISFNSSGSPYVSTPGDIFILRESLAEIVPFSVQFITFYFGGHAGIVYDEDTIIETTGMEPIADNNKVITYRNNVFSRPEDVNTVGLRVKAPEEDIDKAMEYTMNTVDTKYNYSFIFNRKNSYYCTDLVSRSFGKEAGLNYNLDKDGIAVSCNDLIISTDTFITFYIQYQDDEKHVYYAVNE